MDKDFTRNLMTAAMIFALVYLLGKTFLPTPPLNPNNANANSSSSVESQVEGTQTTAGTQPDAKSEQASGGPASGQSDAQTAPAPSSNVQVADEAEESVLLTIGAPAIGEGKDAEETFKPEAQPYRMRLRLSNVGASIDTAWLTDHREVLDSPERYLMLQPVPLDSAGEDAVARSLSIESISLGPVGGGDLSLVSLGQRRWNMRGPEEDEHGTTVRFWLDIHVDDAPALRLTRTFFLPKQPIEDVAKEDRRHDLQVNLTMENLGQQAYRVTVTYRGGVGVKKAMQRGSARFDDLVVDYGVLKDGEVEGQRKRPRDLEKSATGTLTLFSATEAAGQRFEWAATANKYFTCTLAPRTVDGKQPSSSVNEVEAVPVNKEDATAKPKLTVRVSTMALTLDANAKLTLPVEVYLGEKEARSFKHVAAYVSRNYYYQISRNFGFCTFGPLVELMFWLLNSLHAIIPNYGVAIFILVLIVRTLLHPITKRGQVGMVKMQKSMGELQPKMDAVRKKYANDKQKQQEEIMRVYREAGVNPAVQMFTCLPMLLQMPLWVALYISLNYNIAVRHQPFMLWINDLAAPDQLFTFAPVNLPLMGQVSAFNLLPLLVGVAMFAQQKSMPRPEPSPTASPQQVQQQEMMRKMMPLMSLVMVFIFYSMPSGLNLYIMASTGIGALEQFYIRKHIKEREAAGTLLKPKGDGEKRAPGPLSRWFHRLQAMAEEAQKQQPTGGKTKPKGRRR